MGHFIHKLLEIYRNVGQILKSVFPKYEFSGFLEAYEVVDRPILYRIVWKSNRGVVPKRVS